MEMRAHIHAPTVLPAGKNDVTQRTRRSLSMDGFIPFNQQNMASKNVPNKSNISFKNIRVF